MIKLSGNYLVLMALATAAGFFGGCLANLRGPASSQQPLPAVIKAKRFEVVDERGRVIAELTGRALNLMDDGGRIRATLRLQKGNNGVLGFSDATWEGRALFGHLGTDFTSPQERDENWGVAFYDPDRHSLVSSLDTGSDGNRGSLVVRSRLGTRQITAP